MAEDVADIRIAETHDDVLDALREEIGKTGYQRNLGVDHSVTYIERGPKLLVSFETLDHSLRASPSTLPVGLDFVEDKNWSLLHFAARRESWFRAQAVYEFVDDLVDNAFFENFDQIMFYGSGCGAYAACAYSVSSPGASVMAITPQATLDTQRAGWDPRFPDARRLRFDTRYGYAPDMLDGAKSAIVLFDPFRPLDHVHASLFQGSNVSRLRCRHLNEQIEFFLRELELLHRTIEMIAESKFTEQGFYALLRRRRNHIRYLRGLVDTLAKRNRPLHVAIVCRHVLKLKDNAPYFRKHLRKAIEQLESNGTLPDWLSGQ